jgi:hypothetical protein
MNLSWDLHIHPAPDSARRWGDAAGLRAAARRAGVTGFVWKSHDRPVPRTAAVTAEPPYIVPSVTLNDWVTPQLIADVVKSGVQWIWGPSRGPAGAHGWDLPLPGLWPEVRSLLRGLTGRVVLATSHLGPGGRAEFAKFAADRPDTLCSITHSSYLERAELLELARLGCAFEFDLYTWAFPIAQRPRAMLLEQAEAVLAAGACAYLTSDAGQAHVGDPYLFTATALDRLRQRAGSSLLEPLSRDNPRRVVAWLFPPVHSAEEM